MKNGKNTIKFNVNGMHCKSCEMLIKDELSEIGAVESVEVDHQTGKGFLVAKDRIDNAILLKAIENAGYQAEIVENSLKSNGNSKSIFPQVIYSASDGLRELLKDGLNAKGSIKKGDNGEYVFDATLSLTSPVISGNEEVKQSSTDSEVNTVGQKKISLSLFGMHCSSCAGVIEK